MFLKILKGLIFALLIIVPITAIAIMVKGTFTSESLFHSTFNKNLSLNDKKDTIPEKLTEKSADKITPLAIEIGINGGIGPATQDYIARGIQKAEKMNAQFVIIKMNTPGGLEKSTRIIVQDILGAKIPVIVYVTPDGARAASAGTFIMYGATISAMTPGTHLGAATPVSLGFQEEEAKDKPSAMDKKVLNDSISFIKTLAEVRGRNIKFAEEAITEGATLTASEAYKQKVIDYIAINEQDLFKQLNGVEVTQNHKIFTLDTTNIVIELFEPDWRTRFLQVITEPTVAYLLLLLGIYGIFFELMNPGFLAPGIIGAISILIALYALQLLPISYAGLALLIIGVIFIIAEALLPSFGIFGFGGTIAFIIGSIFLIDTYQVDYQIPWSIIWTIAVINIIIIFSVIKIALKLKKQTSRHGVDILLNKTGIALNKINLSGQVIINGEIWSAYSEEPINKNQKIKVIGVDGLILKVKAIN